MLNLLFDKVSDRTTEDTIAHSLFTILAVSIFMQNKKGQSLLYDTFKDFKIKDQPSDEPMSKNIIQLKYLILAESIGILQNMESTTTGEGGEKSISTTKVSWKDNLKTYK